MLIVNIVGGTDSPGRSLDADVYNTLVRAGVPHPEAKQAAEFAQEYEFDAGVYLAVRARVGHEAAMEVYGDSETIDMGVYQALLQAGVVHPEAKQAAEFAQEYEFDTVAYLALRARVGHEAAMEAYGESESIDMEVYQVLVKAGVVHAEAKEAAEFAQEYEFDAGVYLALRPRVGHEAAMEAYREEFDLDAYQRIVEAGHAHTEAMAAAAWVHSGDPEVDVDDYLALRQLGATHAQVEELVEAAEADSDVSTRRYVTAFRETKNHAFALRMARDGE